MKKYIMILLLLFAGLNLYADERTLSLGFEAPLFTFLIGNSLAIKYHGYDVTNLISVDYTKISCSLGFNIKGKFVNDDGIGGMFKAYCFFPYYMNSKIKASNSLYSVGASETKYTTFDPAYIIGAGGGFVKRYYPTDKFNISIDVGGELELDVIGVDLYLLAIAGLGLFSEVAFEFYFTNNWFFDIGVNANLLVGFGMYGYQYGNLFVITDEIGGYFSPSISIGLKF